MAEICPKCGKSFTRLHDEAGALFQWSVSSMLQRSLPPLAGVPLAIAGLLGFGYLRQRHCSHCRAFLGE